MELSGGIWDFEYWGVEKRKFENFDALEIDKP